MYCMYRSGNLLTGFYAGTNVVHVRDAKGCIRDTLVRIIEPAQLRFRLPDIKSPTCEGFRDGSIIIVAYGGAPPYQYALDARPYKAAGSFDSLSEGAYILHVRDSNFCVYDTAITLTGYPHIVFGNPDVTPPSCYGFSNGMIRLDVSGGVPPLSYRIVSPSGTNNTGIFDTLPKGTYTFIITDAKGCRRDTALRMTEPPRLTITSVATPNDCEGKDDAGQLTAIAEGGTEPYVYSWNSGQHADLLKGVGNGIYRVTVTDAHGCRDS